MVTRSIVGRFMILAVLLVSLGVIAQAAIIITQGSGKKVARRDGGPALAMASLAGTPAAAATPTVSDPLIAAAPSATPTSVPAQSADVAPVRVVYPGPLGDAPVQPRKITASLSPSPLDAAAPGQASTAPSGVPASPVVTQAAATPVMAAVAPAAAVADPTPLDAVKPASTTVVASAEPDASAAPAAASGHGVDLNNASVAELNGMGAGHIGQAIVKHRPYHSVDDLMKKRVVRRSIFDQIKNQVAAE